MGWCTLSSCAQRFDLLLQGAAGAGSPLRGVNGDVSYGVNFHANGVENKDDIGINTNVDIIVDK